MQTLCQKMTANMSAILADAKEFDGLSSDYKNKAELLLLKKKLIDEMNTILSEYQEYLWPPQEFTQYNLRLGEKTTHELLDNISEAGIIIKDPLRAILENTLVVAKSKQEAKLIFVSMPDLGFSSESDFLTIYNKAKKMGLDICTKEMATLIYNKIVTNAPVVFSVDEKARIFMTLQIKHFSGKEQLVLSGIRFLDEKFPSNSVMCFSLKKFGG